MLATFLLSYNVGYIFYVHIGLCIYVEPNILLVLIFMLLCRLVDGITLKFHTVIFCMYKARIT